MTSNNGIVSVPSKYSVSESLQQLELLLNHAGSRYLRTSILAATPPRRAFACRRRSC